MDLKKLPFSLLAFLLTASAFSMQMVEGPAPAIVRQNRQCNDTLSMDQKKNELAVDERPLTPSEINYKVFGDRNHPPLILIHGLDSAWQTFYNVIEPLAKDFYLVVYDQRGHGGSAIGGDNFSSALLAEDLKILTDYLQIEKSFVLGHSFGARTAVQFSVLYPERVKGLVIEDMEMHARSEPSPELSEKIKTLVQNARLIPEYYQTREELVAALRPMFGDQAESLSFRRAEQTSDGGFKLLFHPHVTYLYGSQSNFENLLHLYGQIAAPILVMQANPKNGGALSPRGLALMKQEQASATYVFFENAGHTIHRADESKFLQVLRNFIISQVTGHF